MVDLVVAQFFMNVDVSGPPINGLYVRLKKNPIKTPGIDCTML